MGQMEVKSSNHDRTFANVGRWLRWRAPYQFRKYNQDFTYIITLRILLRNKTAYFHPQIACRFLNSKRRRTEIQMSEIILREYCIQNVGSILIRLLGVCVWGGGR